MRLISSFPLTVFNLLNFAAALLVFLFSVVVFMVTAFLILLTKCLHSHAASLRWSFYLCSPLFWPNPRAEVNRHQHSFIPHAGELWIRLPLSVFPSSYDLASFKGGVPRHRSDCIGLSGLFRSSGWLAFYCHLSVLALKLPPLV